jgi:hypothetical protein
MSGNGGGDEAGDHALAVTKAEEAQSVNFESSVPASHTVATLPVAGSRSPDVVNTSCPYRTCRLTEEELIYY